MKKINLNVMIFMSLCIVINLVGGFIALSFKLPIYIDTIGTLLSAVLLGPINGGIVGGLTSIVNGSTFDPISFYFMPVQIIVGLSTGVCFKNSKFEGIKSALSIILITILGSITASIVAAFVFNGVTSSGSSIFVAVFKNLGISTVTAVFSTQIFTDLLDKAVSFALVFSVVKAMPIKITMNLVRDEINGQI
ncbi:MULTISPECIES: ECF transporter S component [unclassified Clostridium]|uniref:Integral membrane protein n=1 Tax=Clostridium botulinum (strain Eklund 17B / Type B) TaxID=935198 RepID=B2TPP9_CLOBB|nr:MULTISPECIES: ECF transporter S component [unclassified Clostridium]ACD21784.1 integral membrane protein [Clostridium botulinum B str. Eklund 17B (NRP)]MBN1039606.1 ECF transporter S component [Clostridium botulinum]MBN1053152.1 ECF transporter S component [Clostridium botulinum]MBN1056348.1 ECF transporter S component [Clostridium botulinum]MBY6975391.1 ECF transporter S component [Clostridium botulinum]